MCLGVPGKVITLTKSDLGVQSGVVQFGGIQKEVCLSFLPDVQVGEYVIVHAGFAISQVDEAEAVATFELLKQMGDLADLGEDTGSGGDALR
ncbi:MAG: HypC/HybG/HupF family hydrogenase formation chaperone [Candidatus Krumholzibacteria bacterium]|jgi:hydrogenase expression/formation protein HypC|nr:HypC/HybG/HupF family hydrogenase formation chaperone [Candidatus Krumholzibacteria bacterium]MDH5271382.1 HypC/HybG/HupF family hydrogenase formation chaperone [Candidatus Krumholzibacteria bacterium]